MLSFRILPRGVILNVSPSLQRLHTAIKLRAENDSSISSSSSSDSSDSSSDSDSDKDEKSNVSSETTKLTSTDDHLQFLLNSMINKTKVSQDFQLQKPQEAKNLKKAIEKKKEENAKFETKINKAAEEVANAIGGDVKQTQTDLLKLIMGNRYEEGLKKSIEKNVFVKKELQKIKNTDDDESLRNLLTSMPVRPHKKERIEHTKSNMDNRAQYVREQFAKSKTTNLMSFQELRPMEKFNLYINVKDRLFAKPVNSDVKQSVPKADIWDEFEKKKLTHSITHVPENYFQEMIQWTEKGILWRFPIDNEQDMDSEDNVHFTEHVFTERYLKGWCPKKGPVRHFMELVCLGLSKNHNFTVEEKKEHIYWYRDYFAEKESILKEVGAVPADHVFAEISGRKQQEQKQLS